MTIQLILCVLAGAALLWQLAIIGMGISYARTGRSVKVGVLPGLLAVALVVAAILIDPRAGLL